MNSPKLTKHNIDEYTKWVDSIVRADLPDAINEPVLFELVKIYQIHHNSKICGKYRNEQCRLCSGHFFTSLTIITQPLEDHNPQDVRYEKMQPRNAILKKVKNYIDDELNPPKKKDDYIVKN